MRCVDGPHNIAYSKRRTQDDENGLSDNNIVERLLLRLHASQVTPDERETYGVIMMIASSIQREGGYRERERKGDELIHQTEDWAVATGVVHTSTGLIVTYVLLTLSPQVMPITVGLEVPTEKESASVGATLRLIAPAPPLSTSGFTTSAPNNFRQPEAIRDPRLPRSSKLTNGGKPPCHTRYREFGLDLYSRKREFDN